MLLIFFFRELSEKLNMLSMKEREQSNASMEAERNLTNATNRYKELRHEKKTLEKKLLSLQSGYKLAQEQLKKLNEWIFWLFFLPEIQADIFFSLFSEVLWQCVGLLIIFIIIGYFINNIDYGLCRCCYILLKFLRVIFTINRFTPLTHSDKWLILKSPLEGSCTRTLKSCYCYVSV